MDSHEEFRQGLKEVQAFTCEPLTLGLPTPLFGGGVALTVAFTIILPWFIGLAFGAVYFYAMFAIHAHDARARHAWRRSLSKRATYWGAGSIRRKKLLIVDLPDRP